MLKEYFLKFISLLSKYPEGTLLKVIDKTEEPFNAEKSKGAANLKDMEIDQLKPPTE